MENISSDETAAWVEQEEAISRTYKMKNYGSLHDYIEEKSKIHYNPVVRKGAYYFTYRIAPEKSTPSLYYQKEVEDIPEELFDPNTLDKKALIRIEDASLSEKDEILALTMNKNGSDWKFIRFFDMKTKKLLPDTINLVKYGSVYWHKQGVFYTTYDVRNTNESLKGQIKGRAIYYHEIGTSQVQDKLVYKPANELKYFGYQVTQDGRHLILYKDTLIDKVWHKTVSTLELTTWPTTSFKTFLSTKKKEVYFEVVGNLNGRMIIRSNLNAPNGALFACNPNVANKLEVLIKAYRDRLDESRIVKDRIISIYSNDSASVLVISDSTGKILNGVNIPNGYKVNYISSTPDDKVVIYGFSSFFSPPSIYKLDVLLYKNEPLGKTYVYFSNRNILTKKVYYYSKDSTVIPMYLTYKKGIKLDGMNPVLLNGYGGFGIKTEPFFDIANILFINNGGVLAVPCIRGGGDFPGWHEAGLGLKKQNSFNDFIAAAEYLIKKKYTNPQKLASMGGSNGGLLVCAAMIQRPDLFKVVVSRAGVLDMLRFHLYNIGYYHAKEYGDIRDSADFNNLYSYSPVHNIKNEVNYPATLFVAGDNDDRVNPFHSFKLLAKLQSKGKSKNPYLLYYIKNAGHQGIGSSQQIVDTKTYTYSFIFKNLDMDRRMNFSSD